MNDIDKVVIATLTASVIVGIIIGFEAGRWWMRGRAIDSGVGKWTINEKTGERKFKYLNIRKKEMAKKVFEAKSEEKTQIIIADSKKEAMKILKESGKENWTLSELSKNDDGDVEIIKND